MNGYEQLLILLDDDEITAGNRYRLIREKLVMYFEWRRISLAEDHADEGESKRIRK